MKRMTNPFVIRLVSAVMLLLMPWMVQAHRAHVHGEGQMQVALDGEALEIILILPAMDVVGFEHRPSTDVQRDRIRQAMERMGNVEQMFLLPASASCSMTHAEIGSELAEQLDTALHQHHEHAKEEHADFTGHYRFSCAHPQQLTSVTAALFQWLPGISLRAEWVTDQGAAAARLSRRAATLALIPGQ